MGEHDLVRIFLTLQREFGARVHSVTPEQWNAPTPNAAWTVAGLVAHLVTEHLWVEPLMRGLDLDAAAAEVDRARALDVVGSAETTSVAAWDDAAARAAAAFSAPGTLQRPVCLSRGNTNADGYVRELIFDLTVHAWDLDQAIGYGGSLPVDVVRGVWEASQQFGDLSASGMFDHPVSVAPDAPVLDQLVGMTGRDPRWSDSMLGR